MKRSVLCGFLLACMSLFSSTLLADHVTLSGLFDGTEPMLDPVSGTCDEGEDMLGYQQIGPIQVSSSALYDVADAGDQVAVDVVIRVYEGSFDPENIQANLVASSVDVADQIPLDAGKTYVLVIQHWCFNRIGAYGVAISGPGDITGTGVVSSPDFWRGEFTLDDPKADFGEDESIYDLNGPIRFDQAGTYFFSDVGRPRRNDLVLQVYEGAFNPVDPSENSVAILDDEGSLQLKAGTDYYFVTYPWNDNEIGEWHFVLFPPGTPALNLFFEGAWNNADTAGQGVLIDVLPTILPDAVILFLAWFTFDELPPIMQTEQGGATTQAVGDPTQRWLTAIGTFREGASRVELSFENTSGGVFNSEVPKPEQDSTYGTGALIAHDCNDVTLEFDLPAGPGEGSTRMARSAPDPLKFELCEALGQQAGVIE